MTPGLVELMRDIRAIVSFCSPSVEPRYPAQLDQPKLNQSDAVVERFYVLEIVL